MIIITENLKYFVYEKVKYKHDVDIVKIKECNTKENAIKAISKNKKKNLFYKAIPKVIGIELIYTAHSSSKVKQGDVYGKIINIDKQFIYVKRYAFNDVYKIDLNNWEDKFKYNMLEVKED